MKHITLKLAKRGFNSELFVDGEPVHFNRLKIEIDGPGKTRLSVSIPNRHPNPFEDVDVTIEGELAPDNIEVNIDTP